MLQDGTKDEVSISLDFLRNYKKFCAEMRKHCDIDFSPIVLDRCHIDKRQVSVWYGILKVKESTNYLSLDLPSFRTLRNN